MTHRDTQGACFAVCLGDIRPPYWQRFVRSLSQFLLYLVQVLFQMLPKHPGCDSIYPRRAAPFVSQDVFCRCL